MPNDVATGKRLRNLRKSKGVTVKFLSDALGIAHSTISMLEKGQRRWTPERIAAYEAALGN